MRVLVTGGAGFVASEVAAVAAGLGHTVEAPDRATLDVTDGHRVEAAIAAWAPDVVVHTAYRERDPGLWDVTVGGTRAVAGACGRTGARLVHLSSDMVFDGREEPWREHDARCPVTTYGRAKAAAEEAVEEAMAATGGGATIVRTSLVLAGPGRAPGRHERAVLDAADGRSDFTFFTDEIRRPVLVADLARAVVAVAGLAVPPPVVHVAGPDPMSRIDMACMVARWHGRDPSVLRSARTADVPGTGPRPGRVVLDCSLAVSLGLLSHG